jgi:UDPglucose 6-dehydrogenase
MKIDTVGIGYVGLSNGILMAQRKVFVCLGIVLEIAASLKQKKFRIEEKEIEDFCHSHDGL